jgi:poly-gamma-glutamate synthesis protein (capsule biosynthesis protein)
MSARAGVASIILLAAALGLVFPIAKRRPFGATVKVNLVGDIMLSRHVAARIRETGDPALPFRGMAGFLRSSDFNFGNLEGPFSGLDGFVTRHPLIFNVPTENIQGLKEYGFKVLSLANNHVLDQGEDGLFFTLQYLADNGVWTAGAGRDSGEAWRPAVLSVRNIVIGFVSASFTAYNDDGKEESPYVARTQDTRRLKETLEQLKTSVDFIIVGMHAGTEYTNMPDEEQKRFARAAIDAGAHVVVGTHPHWVQPVELYKNGLILYSLGNFIFDLEPEETKQGLAVQLRIAPRRLISATLEPIKLENRCCVRPATGRDAAHILQMAHVSSPTILMPAHP